MCRYSDYGWDFLAAEELSEAQRTALAERLQVDLTKLPPALNRTVGDFERLRLAADCFEVRGLDDSSLAKLALLAYYVACDLGRLDLIPKLRDDAAERLRAILGQDDLPAPLRARYAYLAGELDRRSDRREAAVEAFQAAIAAHELALEEDPEDVHGDDVTRLARRMLVRARYDRADAPTLLEQARSGTRTWPARPAGSWPAGATPTPSQPPASCGPTPTRGTGPTCCGRWSSTRRPTCSTSTPRPSRALRQRTFGWPPRPWAVCGTPTPAST